MRRVRWVWSRVLGSHLLWLECWAPEAGCGMQGVGGLGSLAPLQRRASGSVITRGNSQQARTRLYT